MQNSNKPTERQQQFATAPRAINEFNFPTTGYYFIRGVREKEDYHGNIYPTASTNWKKSENDLWEDTVPGNNFPLRLDYLYGPHCTRPDFSYLELKHKVIHIKSVVVSYVKINKGTVSRVIVDWEITGFNDLFDAAPLLNLFNPIVLLAEEEKHRNDELINSLVQFEGDGDIAHNEVVHDEIYEDPAEEVICNEISDDTSLKDNSNDDQEFLIID